MLRREVAHWLATVALFLGTWLSGFFIVATDAWMQHPVGTETGAAGTQIVSLSEIFLSPTALAKVAHTLSAGLLTGAFTLLPRLFARNLLNFITPMVDKETKALKIDIADEVVKGTLVTQNGRIVHPSLSQTPTA